MSKKQESRIALMRFIMSFIKMGKCTHTLVVLISILGSWVPRAYRAEASVPRISTQTYVQGTILPVYMTAGRSTVIDFPCAVTKLNTGTGNDIHAAIGTSIPNEVDLHLEGAGSQSTSLIVRCKEKVFVLEIIPSKNTHQEYLKIKKSIGSVRYHSALNKADPLVLTASEVSSSQQGGIGVSGLSLTDRRLKKLSSGSFFKAPSKEEGIGR
jgi:hypothetical protein